MEQEYLWGETIVRLYILWEADGRPFCKRNSLPLFATFKYVCNTDYGCDHFSAVPNENMG